MHTTQAGPAPTLLTNKPSSAFSTISSAASATSAGSARSGGSRLLFGEIDTSSDRSSESYASVCNLVLSDSSTFLRFWLNDDCRDSLLSSLTPRDLANVRLVCHDFGVRAAPSLFGDLHISFNTATFSRPARLAALDRLGFHVNTLTFSLPHSPNTFLPPLIHPETGDELSFTYTPNSESSSRSPKYGDFGTTDILTRQYPPLFHAATDVPAFIHAFRTFVNLKHLVVDCPGLDPAQAAPRNIVDFALISLRIAIERSCLNALDSLTLSPIHPAGLLYLSPLLGFGATPSSARCWSRIQHLTIHLDSPAVSTPRSSGQPDYFRLLQTYLRNFQRNTNTFVFRWNGDKGPLPILQPISSDALPGRHPAHATTPPLRPNKDARSCPPASSNGVNKTHSASQPLHFPNLRRLEFENIRAKASDVRSLIATHKHTLEELDLKHVDLTEGTWDDAFGVLTKSRQPSSHASAELADIPIMLSPTTGASPRRQPVLSVDVRKPQQQQEQQQPQHSHSDTGRRTLRISGWLGSASGKQKPLPPTPKLPITNSVPINPKKKVRDGLLGGCEESLKNFLRAGKNGFLSRATGRCYDL